MLKGTADQIDPRVGGGMTPASPAKNIFYRIPKGDFALLDHHDRYDSVEE
jgi:hypothetical protein